MSCSSLIRANESSFSLAQKLISSLSEKYSFDAEEAWTVVSNNSISQLQKRFKKLKKANNPLSSIKKPRTSFSFFTKNQRVKIAEKNPKASFGELSKLVSVAWRGLSDKEMKTYKTMESSDKKRYEKEKTELLANIESGKTETTSSGTTLVENTTPKKSNTTKSTTTKSTKSTKTTSTKSSPSSSSSIGNYNAFQKKHRQIIKKENPKLALKDINTKLGEMWRGLSSSQKEIYV
jgi:hypothetical protein